MTKETVGVYISTLNDLYGNLLTQKQREMLRLYYDCDTSLAEIATQYGVTRQAVRDVVERSVATLEGYEAALHLAQKKGDLSLACANLPESEQKKAILQLVENL